MSIKKKSFDQGIKLKPTTEALTDKGELSYSDSDNKLKYKDDSATRTIVNTDGSQTLTNKTISSANNTITVDADTATVSNLEVDNLKSGVLDTDISTTSGSHDTIPSAKAVKDYVDAQILTKDAASEIAFTDSPSFPGTPANVQDALNELNDKVDANATSGSGDLSSHISDVSTHGISVAIVGTTETQTLTNKTLTSPTITGASIQTPSRLDIKQDTEANLTTYALTASNGQLVFATDTKKVYHVKDTLLAEIGGGGSGGTSIEITQTAHGFAVGDGIYYNGSAWVKAQSNAFSTLARFTVFSVPSANQFVAYSFGRVTVTGHGFTVNNFYYLSPSTAGLPTLTEPTSASHYSNPLFYVESSSILIAFVYRPIKAATALDDLSDVATTGATNGQALIFNGSSWSPADVVQNAGDVIYDNSSSALTAIDVQSAIDEIDVDIDDLNTLTGVAKNAQNLGTFTGSTIADNTTVKPALQSLETAQESTASSLSSHIASTSTHGVSGNIVGTTDTQTLTNKTVTDNTFTIQDNADTSKKLQFEASAISASTTRTLTAPNANTTIVGTDVAQVITAKDIDGGTASNTNRITIPKDTRANLDSLTRKAGTILFNTTNDELLFDNGTGLLELDTNVSIKNYIKYSNADRSISGWVTYDDAPDSATDNIPFNGTGGTATCTLTRSSSSPLRGLYSFLFSKPASNEQGEGFSYDFTIDSADKNNVLEISFDYDASNANYADDYMSIFIYDVTNSQLIRFNGEELKGKTNGKFLAFFQASQSTSYRLIAHVVTSTTTAWDVKFDNFKVGPNSDVSVSNTNITAWTSYTPTFTGFGTVSTQSFKWRRVGENIEIQARFLPGTTTATEARITLPLSYTAKSDYTTLEVVGYVATEITNEGVHVLIEPSSSYMVFGFDNSSNAGLSKKNASSFAALNNAISINATIRVSTLTAADTTNAEYSGRFHTITAHLTSNQSVGAGTAKITINTSTVDTTGMLNVANNRIDILEAGFYDILLSAYVDLVTASTQGNVIIRVNGNTIKSRYDELNSGDDEAMHQLFVKAYPLNKGDYVEFFINFVDGSYSVIGGTANSWFTVTKIANPVDVVKSNESVYVEGKSNANQALTANTTNISWAEVVDSHNAWDGSLFTTPITGEYIINGVANFSTSAGFSLRSYVNGSASLYVNTEGEVNNYKQFTLVTKLNKGDTFSIRSTSSLSLTNGTPDGHYIRIRNLK